MSREAIITETRSSDVVVRPGNTVPASIHEGSAVLAGSLAENQHILIAMDAGTYNVQKATCGTWCKTCSGSVDAWVAADPFYVPVSGNTQLSFTSQYNTGQQYDLTSAGTWSSSATSIATVSAGSVNGVSAGAAEIAAQDPDEPGYSSGCYAYAIDCPLYTGVSAGAPSNVGCPQTVSLVSTTPLYLAAISASTNYPYYLTGAGIYSIMQVSADTPALWTGATITESVTQTSKLLSGEFQHRVRIK